MRSTINTGFSKENQLYFLIDSKSWSNLFILCAAPESRQWFSVMQTGTRLINFLSLLALSGNCSLICRRAVNSVAQTVCSHSICLPSILLWQPSCTIRLLNLQLAQCAPFDSSNPTPCACLCFIAFQFWFADIWHSVVYGIMRLPAAGSRQGCQGCQFGNKNWHSSWKPKSMLNWNASEQHFEVRIN